MTAWIWRAAKATSVMAAVAVVALLVENGPALAAFVLTVLAVALVGGVLFAGKSGWCSTFCPVLPVERLYGQSPMAQAPHAHCATCSGCVRVVRRGFPETAAVHASRLNGG